MPTQSKIGILVPTTSAGPLPAPQAYTQFFQQAEALGFDSLWVIDRVFHSINILDPVTLLTWAAASTSRVRIGTAVLLFAMRNPVQVAKTVATLDYLSGGRVTLGISIGGLDAEFQALDVPIKERVGRLREGLRLMRRLWSEAPVTFHGRYFHVENASILPKPVQEAKLPIWMGGQAEAVLKRSGELADGWISGGSGTAEDFRRNWNKVKSYAREVGRDQDQLQSGKLIYVAVDENRARARAMVQTYTHAYYGPRYDVDANCVFGPAAECAAKLQPFVDAGVGTFALGPPGLDPTQLHLIAHQVVPLLR